MPPRRSAQCAAFQSRAGRAVLSSPAPAPFSGLFRRVPALLIDVAVQWPAPAVVAVAGCGLAGAVALAVAVPGRIEPAYCSQAQQKTDRKNGSKDQVAHSSDRVAPCCIRSLRYVSGLP